MTVDWGRVTRAEVELLTGDGSFQPTAQEISTVLRHGYTPLIFLLNDHGCTIERTIMGKDDPYNDRTGSTPSSPVCSHPTPPSESVPVRTNDELRAVLDAPHPEFLLVETLMEKDDVPEALIRNGHELATQDFGPRGRQNEPGVKIQLPATQAAMGAR